jgi:hypothetical protein
MLSKHKIISVFIFVLSSFLLQAQDKRGNTVIFGGGGVFARFNGDTSKPLTGQLFPTPINPNDNVYVLGSHSCISDSVNGNILFFTNGSIMYDIFGHIIENGDSLQCSKIYMQNCCPSFGMPLVQGSIILPKGSNREYYVFIPTITDTSYDYLINNPFGDGRFPFNLLQYHIVDMNANNGLGKVIQKNIPLLENLELNKTGILACKHANGYDWWLLKQGANDNIVYTFLVTKDSVVLDTIQTFPKPIYGYYDGAGQSCFNSDGSKYAFASGGGFANTNGAQLCIYDFDRCYGILSNPKVINVPYDSTLTILDQQWQAYDSLITGIAFSPNDSFLYVARRYNIYQYELNEPDSNLAWYHLQQGIDTTFQYFIEYGQLHTGVDGRIYIGKWGGGSDNTNSLINTPNQKGVNSTFCKKCINVNGSSWYSNSFSNMPNFNMPKKEPCAPLDTPSFVKKNAWEVYPNPSSSVVFIKNRTGKRKEFYNVVGKLLLSTIKDEINVSSFSKGIYFIKCEGETKKVIVE